MDGWMDGWMNGWLCGILIRSYYRVMGSKIGVNAADR